MSEELDGEALVRVTAIFKTKSGRSIWTQAEFTPELLADGEGAKFAFNDLRIAAEKVARGNSFPGAGYED